MPVVALTETGAQTLASIVTADMLSGVFSEIMSLLPVVVPVTVGFIAIRKGLGFLFGSLRQA